MTAKSMIAGKLQGTGGSHRLPSFEHARVSDAMRTGVIACPLDAPLETVARMMATNHVHAVIVTGGSDAPFGVVSERELLAAADTPDAEAASIAVDPVVVGSEDTLSSASALMLDRGVSHVVVTNASGHPLGVLSALDVAGVLAWGRA